MPTVPILAVLVGALLWGPSCAGGSGGRARNAFESSRLWIQYSELSDSRALALAGDPSRTWVAGMAGGQPTVEAAQRKALAACGQRRSERRIQEPCRLYASGDRVVWKGP